MVIRLDSKGQTRIVVAVIITAIVVGSAVYFVGMGAGPAPPEEEEEEEYPGGKIPVGITADLTGPTSFISAMGTGASYYLEYANEMGGLDDKYFFDPVVRDGAEDLATERTALNYYTDIHKAVLVNLWATPACVGLAPDIEEEKIPMMGNSKAEKWAVANEYTHLFGTSYEDYLRIYMDFAKEEYGEGARVAILYTAWAPPPVERVTEERKYQDKIGVNVVKKIQHEYAPADLTSEMSSIWEADPDFIICLNTIEDAIPMLEAAETLGIPRNKIGIWNWATIQGTINQAGETAEGLYGINEMPTKYPADVPAHEEIEFYMDNISGIPERDLTGQLYDGWARGKVIHEIARIAKEEIEPKGELPLEDTMAMRAAFQEAWGRVDDFDTGCGLPTFSYVDFPLKGTAGATIYQVQNGEWASIEERFPEHPFKP